MAPRNSPRNGTAVLKGLRPYFLIADALKSGTLPCMQGRSPRAARPAHHSHVHKFKETSGVHINIRTVLAFAGLAVVVIVNQGHLVSYLVRDLRSGLQTESTRE